MMNSNVIDIHWTFQVKRMREKVTGRGLTTGYLEGADSDEEDISIAAIKNKYKKNKQGTDTTQNQDYIKCLKY